MPIAAAIPAIIQSVTAGLLGKAPPAAYEKWISSHQMQTDLDGSWADAKDLTLTEYSAFGSLVDERELLKTVVEHALDPYWLKDPDRTEILNTGSLRWITSEEAGKAAATFLRHFTESWKHTKSFAQKAQLFEEIQQNKSLDAIRSAIESALKTGFAIRTAPASAPPPALLLDYVKRIQTEAGETHYLDRTVVKKTRRSEAAEPAGLAHTLDQNARAVLIGEGGLGKTMALRHRERQLAARYAEAAAGLVPILLRMSGYTGGSIERLVANRITDVLKGTRAHLAETPEEAEQAVRRWLEEGNRTVEVMFDGLNEAPEKHAEELRSELEGFLRYEQRFVFTSRNGEALPGPDIPVFLLQPLTPSEVTEFLREKLAGSGEELFAGVESDYQLAELLQNPFFLEIIVELAMVPGWRMEARRALLIREYVARVPQALREEGRAAGPASRSGVMNAFLKELGWKMLRSGVLAADYSTTYEWNLPLSGIPLEEMLKGASAFRHLRSSGLTDEPVEFRHPLLRDYFAAERIRGAVQKGAHLDGGTEGQYKAAGWHDPVRMTAGLLGTDSSAMVEWLVNQGCHDLAFDCWRDSDASQDPRVTALLAAAVRGGITRENIPFADTIIVQLGELRDANAVPWIREFMDRVGPWARFEAVPALEKIRTPEAFETLVEWLRHRDEDTGRLAAESLRRIGGGAIPALLHSPSGTAENILRELAPRETAQLMAALQDSDRDVRARAVQALAASNDPTAAMAVAKLIGPDGDSEILVRTAAAISLKKLRNPAAVPALTTAMATEENPGARFEAAAALWENGFATEEARAALFQMYGTLGGHPLWKVRILQSLANRPDAEILSEIFKACRDSNDQVRGGAFQIVRDLVDAQPSANVDEVLAEGLRDSSDFIRTVAAGALFRRHQSDALQWIGKAFEEDPAGRASVLDSVWPNYGERGRAFLIGILTSGMDQKVRARAAANLHRFSGEETHAALADALDKADAATESNLVFYLIRGLRHSTDPRVIARLQSIAEDPKTPDAFRHLAARDDDQPADA